MKQLVSVFLLLLCLTSLAIAAQSSYVYLPLVSRMPTLTLPPSLTLTPVCQELVWNGGFEWGDRGWRLSRARLVVGERDWPQGRAGLLLSTEDDVFPEGTSSAACFGFQVPTDAADVRFAFWYKLVASAPGSWTNQDNLHVYVSRPEGGSYYSYYFTTCADCYPMPFGDGWQRVEWDVTLLAGREVTGIRFSFYNNGQYLSTLLIDDVSVLACR